MNIRVVGITAPARYRTDIDAGGYALVADEPAALGGSDAGATPFGLVLAGLAACTAATLRMYAEHKGWPPIAMRMELAVELGAGRRTIQRRVDVSGASGEALERLRDIVERTPVTLALKSGFDIATRLDAA